MEQLYLTEEQKQILADYFREKRYTRKISLIILSVLIVLLAPICLGTLEVGIKGITVASNPDLAKYDGTSSIAGDSFELVFMAMFGIVAAGFVVYKLVHGHFGRSGDLGCIVHDDYELHTEPYSTRSAENPETPYQLYDQKKLPYLCIRYQDWKHAPDGAPILFITLKNGNRYALRQTEEELW